MQEKEFSPEQSLHVIQSMIEKARNQFSENGHLYLLWGWVVFVCSVAQFTLLKFFQYEKHYMVWMLTWLAVIYQFIYLAKRKRKEKVKTYTDSIVSFVWLTFVVTMILMGFIIANGQSPEYYKLINSVFLALYAIPTFLSGIILRFRPLIIGGISCWGLAVLSNFMPYDYQLLLLSLAMVIAWIIPGYLLRAKYKEQKS